MDDELYDEMMAAVAALMAQSGDREIGCLPFSQCDSSGNETLCYVGWIRINGHLHLWAYRG